MKYLLLVICLLELNVASAKPGDTDESVCDDIRAAATDTCRNAKDFSDCYSSEVSGMVHDYNSETSDLSGGGELTCDE